MARCSIAEFEKLYLRFGYAKRYLKHADPAILDNVQFKRSVQYIVNLYAHKERLSSVMLRAGFDEDDLRSIATVFGLVFNGRQRALGENPENFVNMIRFVSQRMQKFCEWAVKKFSVDDTVEFRIGASSGSYSSGEVNVSLLDNSFSLGNAVDGDELETKLAYAVEDLKELYKEYDEFLDGNRDVRSFRRIRRQMNKAKEILREEKSTLSQEARLRGTERKKMLVEMRETLAAQPDKYREELCRYATYKMVASDVRRAARIMCGKLGIDYKAWALEQINSGKVDGYQLAY